MTEGSPMKKGPPLTQGPPLTHGLRIYNLFPTLAGSVAGWTAQLPRIAAMAFDAVYINPFHYPGFSGSLYAVKDYYRLNPRFRGAASEGIGADGVRRSDDELLRAFTAAVLGGILTANAAREIVLRPHLGGLSLNRRFLHNFVFHASSLRER